MAHMDEEEDYFLPLQDQRIFGAGIKRKRVPFVPASNLESTQLMQLVSESQAGDRYLSIVLPNIALSKEPVESPDGDAGQSTVAAALCTICKQPLTSNTTKNPHESSIAHQVCLEHSHPPSHLDRDRVGLKYLSGYGWDPDSRKGLGMREEGIRIPVKAKAKHDTVGLGVEVRTGSNVIREPEVRLNAKEIRKKEGEMKRKAAQLRGEFYGRDLEQYLGPGG